MQTNHLTVRHQHAKAPPLCWSQSRYFLERSKRSVLRAVMPLLRLHSVVASRGGDILVLRLRDGLEAIYTLLECEPGLTVHKAFERGGSISEVPHL